MTSSSLELYPCQVQLMGLPRGAANGVEQRPPVRAVPARATVQRVSRNLFGTADRNAIAQVLEAGQQSQRLYVMQRYNIDIDALEESADDATPSAAIGGAPNSPPATLSPLPSLIVQELQQHKLRLLEKRNLSRVKASEITPPSSQAQIRRTISAGCNSNNNNSNNKNSSNSNHNETASNERSKPYARQPQLTESFNLRKTASQQFNGISTATTTTPTPTPIKNGIVILSTQQQQQQCRRAEVLKLPKSMRASLVVADMKQQRATQTDLDEAQLSTFTT